MRQDEWKAMSTMFPELYDELHRLAGSFLSLNLNESLQTTDLAHEAYLRLAKQEKTPWRDRRHFFALSAMMIRRVLVDHSRSREVRGRTLAGKSLTLRDGCDLTAESQVDLLSLHEALESLADRSPRSARLVELRFFGGLTLAECAKELDISERTASDDWAVARAWLLRELSARDA